MQAKTAFKTGKRSVPNFDKALSRDNLVYRITDGYNLDNQEQKTFFGSHKYLKKIYNSSRSDFDAHQDDMASQNASHARLASIFAGSNNGS